MRCLAGLGWLGLSAGLAGWAGWAGLSWLGLAEPVGSPDPRKFGLLGCSKVLFVFYWVLFVFLVQSQHFVIV